MQISSYRLPLRIMDHTHIYHSPIMDHFHIIYTDGFFQQKSSIVAVLQILPLLVAIFTSKIIAPPSAQLVDPFYRLQCKFIVRNCKSTLKQLIYLHASLLTDGMLCQWRTRRTNRHTYILKPVLGDIYFCYTISSGLIY